MSARKSLKISGDRVTVQTEVLSDGTVAGLAITIHEPTRSDLLRLIADASKLLEYKERMGKA